MSASREGLARRSRLLDRDAHLVPFRTRNSPKFEQPARSAKEPVVKNADGRVLFE